MRIVRPSVTPLFRSGTILYATADESQPNTNISGYTPGPNATASALGATERIQYAKFSAKAMEIQLVVNLLSLRITPAAATAMDVTATIYRVDDAFDSTTLTWSNRPALGAVLCGARIQGAAPASLAGNWSAALSIDEPLSGMACRVTGTFTGGGNPISILSYYAVHFAGYRRFADPADDGMVYQS